MRQSSPHRVARLVIFAAAVAAAAACGPPIEGGTRAAPRRNTSIMDTAELRGHNFSTVYDAISARHADWLLPRGGPSGGRNPTLGVWIEGSTRSLGVEYLRTIRPVDIGQVRRLSTTESLHSYNWPWGGLVLSLR